MWPAVRLGLLISLVPLLLTAVLPGMMFGWELQPLGMFLFSFLLTFFLAVHEDVIFVGYLQTRLYGLFKSNVVAISVGAALFALMHVPSWILMGTLTFDYPLGIALMLVVWFTFHFIAVSVFRKYFSLIPVIMLHTVLNFSGRMWNVRTEEGGIFGTLNTVILLTVACVLVHHMREHRQKTI